MEKQVGFDVQLQPTEFVSSLSKADHACCPSVSGMNATSTDLLLSNVSALGADCAESASS